MFIPTRVGHLLVAIKGQSALAQLKQPIYAASKMKTC